MSKDRDRGDVYIDVYTDDEGRPIADYTYYEPEDDFLRNRNLSTCYNCRKPAEFVCFRVSCYKRGAGFLLEVSCARCLGGVASVRPPRSRQ